MPLRVDLLLASRMSNKADVNVLHNFCFKRPKHQSGINLARRKEYHELHASTNTSNSYFVLATTIVCMDVDICFSGSMLLKQIMNVADRRICSFSSRNWFINEIINLPWYRFTANAKYTTFIWCFEVNGTQLLRIGQVVPLRGVIMGIKHGSCKEQGPLEERSETIEGPMRKSLPTSTA